MRLSPDELWRRCDPAGLSFESTSELEPADRGYGQERAVSALLFALEMRHEGYNAFAMGPSGAGKHTLVEAVVRERASKLPVPLDVCYVNDFDSPSSAKVLRVPAGRGRRLRAEIHRLLEDLRAAIPGALESDDFRARKAALENTYKERNEKAVGELRERALARDVTLVQTPVGPAFAPVQNGEILQPAEFQRLPEEARKKFEAAMEELGAELGKLAEQMPRWEQEARRDMRKLIVATLLAAIDHLVDDLVKIWSDLPDVVRHLEALKHDILENAGAFMKREDGLLPVRVEHEEGSPLRRWQVNLLIDNDGNQGAPVVFEDHPTYDNLIGRVEHQSKLGALVTDFTLVRAGALHRANGGYLLIDARNLLLAPYAWDGLKRALFAKQIRMESLAQVLGLASTVSLEPEPVPLDVKIILLGERRLFHLLSAYDADFQALFKVAVDFDDEVPRTTESELMHAREIARLGKAHGLRAFDRSAVARVIEHGSRAAGDAEKISTHTATLVDLLREADHGAEQRSSAVVSAADVDGAIRGQRARMARVQDRVVEEIVRGTLLVDTSGAKIGQVNGLAVYELGPVAFGRPTRITARVRLGQGEVVDIERDVELGGKLHSKGVMILSAFLAARYTRDVPLSLVATIAFEQSYGQVDGDSASSAELYALLSAIGEVPLKQSFAVTGSVNQHGEVQAIGGVNEKIEGFFDVCRARGLTGEQGVLIPRANVKHLMLRADVVDAVRGGRFHVHAASTIDEGIELLTGLSAGAQSSRGEFPSGSINGKVAARLSRLASSRADFGARDKRGA